MELQRAKKHANVQEHVLPTSLLTANRTTLFKLELWHYNQQMENRIFTPRLLLLPLSSLSTQLAVHIDHFKLHHPQSTLPDWTYSNITLLLSQHSSTGPIWLHTRISTLAVTPSPRSHFSMVECCRNNLKTCPSFGILLLAHTLQKIKTGLNEAEYRNTRKPEEGKPAGILLSYNQIVNIWLSNKQVHLISLSPSVF